MKLLLVSAFCVALAFAQDTSENATDSKTKNIRRQVPAYGAPLYAAPPPVFAAPPPAVFAAPAAYALPAPAPIPVPVAPGPAFLPPLPPPVPVAPMPAYQPPPPACAPACVGNAACVAGACACPAPVVYNPVVGCAPLPPPPPPVPVVAGRLIPQALPGAPCEPGVECTGGSVCSMGICLCPPELVQEGTVCVSRTIYGIVAPPPPPPLVVPAPIAIPAPVALAPAPVAYAPAPVAVPAPIALAPGAACVAAAPTPCAPGAFCDPGVGVCRCGPAYTPVAGSCIRRKLARKEATSEEKPEEQQ